MRTGALDYGFGTVSIGPAPGAELPPRELWHPRAEPACERFGTTLEQYSEEIRWWLKAAQESFQRGNFNPTAHAVALTGGYLREVYRVWPGVAAGELVWGLHFDAHGAFLPLLCSRDEDALADFWPVEPDRQGPPVTFAKIEARTDETQEPAAPDEEAKPGRVTEAQTLVKLANNARLFHTPDGETTFATHTFPIDSLLHTCNNPPMLPQPQRLAQRLKRQRLKRGLSQSELARRADVAHSTVWRLEEARHVATLAVLERLAKALRCRVGDLLG